MSTQVIVTVQMNYECEAAHSSHDQAEAINNDMLRLFDCDSTTGVSCRGISIKHLSTEALTYGNAQARETAERQSERILSALSDLYSVDRVDDVLRYALCDLRHLADQKTLSFDAHDKDAFAYYRAEKDDDDQGLSDDN